MIAGPQLRFAIVGAERVEHVAVPTLAFALEVRATGVEDIRSLLLDVQLQIGARRRGYDEATHDRLFELFGPVSAWGSTLQNLLWTRMTRVVPPFHGSTVVDLPVVCTYDLEVAASRYLDALGDGEVPLEFLFTGAVFYAGPGGALQTVRIPWDAEAQFALPVATWRATMDAHFPHSAWLRLDRDAFGRLAAYKSRNALPSWEAALDALLEAQEA